MSDAKEKSDIQELTWAMLDNLINEAELVRLEAMLTESEEARKIYMSCVHLEMSLREYFAAERRKVQNAPPQPPRMAG